MQLTTLAAVATFILATLAVASPMPNPDAGAALDPNDAAVLKVREALVKAKRQTCSELVQAYGYGYKRICQAQTLPADV